MIPVEIFTHEMNVPDNLHDYVTKKVTKLDRYINSLEAARVDLTYRKALKAAEDRCKVQITLRGKGFVLRAEERTDQPHSAFDLALEKIERQLERYRGKHYPVRGNAKSVSDEAAEAVAALYVEEEPAEIVRRKKFMLHPMDEAEAMEQMRLLGQETFFIFYNMNTAGVSVLYKRRDGSFGLIDTELA